MLLVLVSLAGLSCSAGEEVSSDLKVWSDCSSGVCECGANVHRAVGCTDEFLWIQPCYCMYYDHSTNRTLLGNCLLTCYYFNKSSIEHYYYPMRRYSVQNASLFNDAMCSPSTSLIVSNRTGRFCGRCKPGHGLAVYSYRYTGCIPCTDYGYKNWLRYFAVALLPLTLFYFLVIILRINITSSRLNGVIFVVQCLTAPAQIEVIDGWSLARAQPQNRNYIIESKQRFVILQVVMSISGFVNLDFFRTLYSPFCLHPDLNMLHVTSLDYIIALYPFLLIFLTYVLVTIYNRNYRVIVWAWRPFKWCLGHYTSRLDVRASLIEAFASFVLLSSVKILGVCFEVLLTTRIYDSRGSKVHPGFLYYDANIEYFGPEHLPFAVLALLMGFVFVLLPFLLLILYPCRCFQRCLNFFGCRCRLLHVFMDAFQGSYKTEPWDLRYFSGFYLLLRFLALLTTEGIASVVYLPTIANLMVVAALIIGMFEPYKTSFHNKMDMFILLCVSVLYSCGTADVMAFYLDWSWLVFTDDMFYSVPIILISTYCILRLWVRVKMLFLRVLEWKSRLFRKKDAVQESIQAFDRGQYEPVPGSVYAR